jgi:GT2 family glycosyltransferase
MIRGEGSEERRKIAIVAPVHNRRDLTLLCLKSIKKLNSEGLEIMTFIVDDGSTDGTSEEIKKVFPDTEIIQGAGDLWFTEGTNVGVRKALEWDPDHVLMINDDQVFDSDCVRSMVETAERYPRSVVGSLLLLWDTPHRLFQLAPKWSVMWGGWRHWHQQTIWTVPDVPWEVGLIVGNCVLVPRAAIEECGLMDSKRFPNFGDAEYTPRLKRNGWKLIIDPRARVFCQPNTIPPRVGKMSLRQKLNALFVDLGNIHNLRRRFYFYWYSAPSKLEALAAFVTFFVRYAIGKNLEGKYGETQIEEPLAVTYSDLVLNENKEDTKPERSLAVNTNQ